ncbi:MAG TPA: alpha/beta fold hydrolase [Methylomirabilota bacterium]|nr:alpha/beta fold hydrolase [Methylomirabilota bacterium]
MKRPVTFYSEGVKLVGDVYLPDDLAPGQRRAGVVLCHGYTGVKDLYLPDNARVLNEAGYVALTFDYKGWGDSEGPRARLAPWGRVADAQAALTYLGALPEVDPARLGLYGTSYGGATVVWVAAVDPRVACTVSVVGIGHGQRWMRSVRRPDEWFDLLARSEADRLTRARDGRSELVDRAEILLPDRQSAELAAAARRNNPAAVSRIPLEYVDDTLGFNPEWVVDRIAPRPVLFITTDNDRLVPPEESAQLHARAGEPKRLVVLKGYGHYEVYAEPAFSEVMRATLDWYGRWLPPRLSP